MTVISDGLICSMLNMIHRKSAVCRIVNAIHVFTHLRSREHNSIRVPGNHCELLWTYSADLSVKPYQTPEQVERIWQIFVAKYSRNTAALTTDFSPDSLQFSIRATFIRENLPPAAWIHRVQFIHSELWMLPPSRRLCASATTTLLPLCHWVKGLLNIGTCRTRLTHLSWPPGSCWGCTWFKGNKRS